MAASGTRCCRLAAALLLLLARRGLAAQQPACSPGKISTPAALGALSECSELRGLWIEVSEMPSLPLPQMLQGSGRRIRCSPFKEERSPHPPTTPQNDTPKLDPLTRSQNYIPKLHPQTHHPKP